MLFFNLGLFHIITADAARHGALQVEDRANNNEIQFRKSL